MRWHTLAAGLITATSMAALIGFDTTAASAVAASGGTGSLRDGADSTGCDDVYLWAAPGGDPVGTLCITVNHDGTMINAAVVTFTTTSDCSGTVLLRVSGADENGREFGVIDAANCETGTATASFKPVSQVIPDTYICATILDNRFTPPQACAAIPGPGLPR